MRVVGGVASGYQPHPRGGERPIRLDGLAGPSAPVPQHVGESYRAGQMRSAPMASAKMVPKSLPSMSACPTAAGVQLGELFPPGPPPGYPPKGKGLYPTASAAQSRRVQQ